MNSNDSSWIALVLQYPSCVTPCMQSANKNSHCLVSDIQCHCVAGFPDWLRDLSDCFNQTSPCSQQEYNYFTKLGFETCKQYRTDPYPTFIAKPANITAPQTPLNTTEQDRSQSNSALLQRHSSLSTAEYAGIGIGAGVFILGLAALAVFIYRRKNAMKSGQSRGAIHEVSESNVGELAAAKDPQELHATERDTSKQPVELDANNLAELDSTKR